MPSAWRVASWTGEWLRGRSRAGVLCAYVLVGALVSAPLEGQEIALPEEQQVSLYARLLPFDRHLMGRGGDEIVIGVLYQADFRESVRSKDAFLDAAGTLSMIGDVPTRFVMINASGSNGLKEVAAATEIHVLYVAPLRAIDLLGVRSLCEQYQISSITGVPEYVDRGIAVGIGERGGKPEILVNSDTADAIGIDFDSRFLRLVTLR